MTLRSKPNRLYLYLLRPDGERGAYQWIASANGFLPSLWRILLAEARPAPLLQHVLPDDVSTWIAVDARLALARFHNFGQFILRHPRVDEVTGLRRYLAAAECFLEDSTAAWESDGQAAPCFSTNLAQLPASDPSITVLPDHLLELGEFREALDRIVRSDDFLAIDAALGFPQRNLRFADWKAWSGMFGLAQLEPDYFSSAFRRPCEGDYADHDYDELGSVADLGDGCQRYKSGGRWGVRRLDGVRIIDVLAPEWDRILRTGPGIQSLVWVRRNGRFGLARIAGADRGRILHGPDLDEVHAFVDGLARVRSGADMGLLAQDGTWYLSPCMDEIHAFAHGRAVVRSRGLYGYIDAAAVLVIGPTFDEADDFTAFAVARVRNGECCGLIRRDGNLALPLQFSVVEWSDAFGGWCCQRDGAWTLARGDGSTWIDGGWDAIEVFVHGHLIRVRRGASFGLLRWNGETLLECQYDELLTRDTHGIGPLSAQSKKSLGKSPLGKKSPARTQRLRPMSSRRQPALVNPESLEVIARRNGLVGMVGSDAGLIIPFEFARIDALEPHFENDQRLFTPELMRVLSVPGRAAPRVGVWDIQRRHCIVPCAYDFVWTSLFGVGNSYGFIVGNRNPKRGSSLKGRYRVGLLHADGRVLVPQEYAWIGECTPLNRDDAMGDVRSTLYHYWSRGEPVRAALDERGPLVGLPPPLIDDGRFAAEAVR